MKIYLVLTGEGNRHPRIRKVLQLVRKDIKKGKDFKILISGFSSFNLNVKISEAKIMQDFLLEKEIDKSKIILEENSMDTLGNMVFSCEILKKLIERFEEEIEIILITEKFHMERSKFLFLQVCSWLLSLKPNIRFKFISARTNMIPQFIYKVQFFKLLNDIKSFFKSTQFEKDLFSFFKQDKRLLKQEIRDLLILEILKKDFHHFHLNSYFDYRNFLFSLPVYNEKFVPDSKYNLAESFYAKGILHFTNK